MNQLMLHANAKINLTLGITGKRDDGYHEIDTIMQSIDLYDVLKIKKSNKITINCSIGNISGKENIAYRAAELFFKETEIPGGAEIYIEKNIPTAAGLGGGSADAAAVLIALNMIYDTQLSYDTLCSLAFKLGADVPFFIRGGTQRGQGIGEILSEQQSLKSGFFVLAKTEQKPSTASMYRCLDLNKIILPDTEKALNAISHDDISLLSDCLMNSFSDVWKKSVAKEVLKKTGPLAVSLSGSGPVWFASYQDIDSAKNAVNELKSQNIDCWLTKPCNFSIRIV